MDMKYLCSVMWNTGNESVGTDSIVETMFKIGTGITTVCTYDKDGSREKNQVYMSNKKASEKYKS